MPEVAIYTENVVIAALSSAILFKGERLKYMTQNLIWHILDRWPLPIKPRWHNIVFLGRNQ
jgi:hypothetical protein